MTPFAFQYFKNELIYFSLAIHTKNLLNNYFHFISIHRNAYLPFLYTLSHLKRLNSQEIYTESSPSIQSHYILENIIMLRLLLTVFHMYDSIFGSFQLHFLNCCYKFPNILSISSLNKYSLRTWHMPSIMQWSRNIGNKTVIVLALIGFILQ